MNGLPINIDDLLKGRSVEWERLEFKEGWNPLAVLHTVCAFANDFHNMGGGYIVLGVEEANGRPVLPPKGIDPDRIDDIQKELYNLGFAGLQPNYHPVVVPHQVGDVWILVIWVPGGQSRPYKAKTGLGKEHREYAYFIRQNSRTVKAIGPAENELIALAANVPFDDRVNQTARITDLDSGLMRKFLKEVGSDLIRTAADADTLQLARHMKLVGGQSEAPFPLNVGLHFFNPDPQETFFPTVRIEVAWFPDGPAGDTFTEKIFTGPLDRMLRESLDYIQRNYINEMVMKHAQIAQATRSWNFPFAALEEALVNAVYHRSYEEREPIEVRITPDELTILSYPGPDRSINMEQLRAGRAVSRRYRNRRIGEFLKELELTEGRATGIPKIIRAMKENGSPEPLFETEDERLSFLVRLPVLQESAPLDIGTKLGPSRDQVLTIRNCLTPTPLLELMRLVGRTNRTKFRDQVVAPLVQAGFVEMTLPEKPRSSKQKYRATSFGKVWLERVEQI